MLNKVKSWLTRWFVLRTRPGKPFVVGLTGGIASGKTAASNHFSKLGVPVVDTDVIAREIVEPGQPAHGEIVRRFGDTVVRADGRLDRAALREQVFQDSLARRDLEKITHPRIRQAASAAVRRARGPYVLLVVPLLIESPLRYAVDRILVVDVDPGIQLERLLARDNISESTAHAMVAAQTDRETRLEAADDILLNSGTLAALENAVAALHAKYLVIVEPDP